MKISPDYVKILPVSSYRCSTNYRIIMQNQVLYIIYKTSRFSSFCQFCLRQKSRRKSSFSRRKQAGSKYLDHSRVKEPAQEQKPEEEGLVDKIYEQRMFSDPGNEFLKQEVLGFRDFKLPVSTFI